MRLFARVVTLTLMFAVVAPAHAQTTTSTGVAAASDSNIAAPRAKSDASLLPAILVIDTTQRVAAEMPGRDLRVAAHYTAARQPAAQMLAQRQRAGLGQPMAMMVVGGAALLAGAIIGDTPGTIIMIGGAVVGLIGLYEYLQ